MKQAVIKKGEVIAIEIPSPKVDDGCVLIKVEYSCISVGTEVRGVEESGKSLFKKTIEKPEKIRQIIDVTKSYGIGFAFRKIQEKKDEILPTGYSVSGVITAVGKRVIKFSVGDRIAAAGASNAFHAGKVNVPINLVVPIKKDLSFRLASTVAIGSIALHSVRRCDLGLGELCIVYGTGVLGLIAVQMLIMSGVRVAAIDIDDKKLEQAKDFGAEVVVNANNNNLIDIVKNWSGGYGVDAALLAAGTASSEPVSNCLKICKRKGKVVVLGAAGLNINRSDIYPNELDIITSTSYGPGRYDKTYENQGVDYPYGYVRWTENRNMAEYLRLVSESDIDVESLISKDFEISKVEEAFTYLSQSNDNPLIVLLKHNEDEPKVRNIYPNSIAVKEVKNEKISLALVGVSSFLIDMHLPNLKRLESKYNIQAVVNRTGYKAKAIALKYNAYATSGIEEVLNDSNIDLVMITTSHGEHANAVIKCIIAGKHVFVEKPLATNAEELENIKSALTKYPGSLLMVGFNRRFSSYAKEIKKHVEKRINPLIIQYRINAGYKHIDDNAHDFGGRIVGEACHIIDLASYLIDSAISSISCESMSPNNDYYSSSDNRSMILKYEDGSIVTIQYFANGSNQISKEYMEVHFDGKSIIMNDYKSMKGYGINIKEIKRKVADKGHFQELVELYEGVKSGEWPIQFEQMIETTKIAIEISHL